MNIILLMRGCDQIVNDEHFFSPFYLEVSYEVTYYFNKIFCNNGFKSCNFLKKSPF